MKDLKTLKIECSACTACGLCKTRKKAVFGKGNVKSELIFVGEAPGADEDACGEPFVGKAGRLLTKMINAMGLQREDVYITNVVHCRPPDNRKPTNFEMDICSSRFLNEEIRIVQPKALVALGATAAQAILRTKDGIGRLRGRFHRIEFIDVMPTFHPAYLLREPKDKGRTWNDLKLVMDRLGIEHRGAS